MQMFPIPCYFPRNRRRAPCGRSNCFPLMWKTNQEKEGREWEREIATHPLSPGCSSALCGWAVLEMIPMVTWFPYRSADPGVRHGVQSPGNVFFIPSYSTFSLVFYRGTKPFKGGNPPCCNTSLQCECWGCGMLSYEEEEVCKRWAADHLLIWEAEFCLTSCCGGIDSYFHVLITG